MKRLFSCVLVLASLSLACAGVRAEPVPLAETEANDTAATAQVLSPGAFTDLSTLAGRLAAADGEVFDSLNTPHVSIDGALSAPADVDFYRFAVTAPSTGFFDIDRAFGGGQAIDLSLALFDAVGRVLAWGTGACAGVCSGPVVLDPGSTDFHDPFIGEYAFASAGSYTIAVMADGLLPDTLDPSNPLKSQFSGVLTRPGDLVYGGNAYLPNAGPASLIGSPISTATGSYRLQVSLSAPAAVPAPPVTALMGGLMALSLIAGRCSGRIGRRPVS